MKKLISVALVLAMVLSMSLVAFAAETKVYCDAPDSWAKCYVYTWSGNGATKYTGEWPGTPMTKNADGLWEFTVPDGAEKIIFNNGQGGGANQTTDLSMPTGSKVKYDFGAKTWGEIEEEFEPVVITNITVYCQTPEDWETCHVHYWGSETGDSSWPGVPMTKGDDGVWSVEIPSDVTGLLFNMQGDVGKTSDLTLPTDGKLQYVIGGDWTEPGTKVEVEEKYFVAGTASLCGIEWKENAPENAMTKGDDGLWVKEFKNVPAGEHKFKVTDGTWNNPCGDPVNGDRDGNYVLTLTVKSNVTINFNTADETIAVVVEPLEEPEVPDVTPDEPEVPDVTPDEPVEPAAKEYCLVGYINGADYGHGDDNLTIGEYIFVDGTLTTSFTQDSYIFVKTTDNANWYMTGAYTEETTATFVIGGSEKMKVPGNVELTFTLVENADGSVTVSYVTGDPVDPDVPGVNPDQPGENPDEPEQPTSVTVYCQTPDSWETCHVHYWGSASGQSNWPGVPMTKGDNGIWYADIPADVAGLLFNKRGDDGKTGDLTLPGNGNLQYVIGGDWVEPGNKVEVAEKYSVAGTAGLCGTEWTPAAAENLMTKGEDGLWVKEFKDVPAGEHQFKVTDGTWNNSWGDPNGKDGNISFTTTDVCDVTVKFDAATKVITLIVNGETMEFNKPDPTDPKPTEPKPTEPKPTEPKPTEPVAKGSITGTIENKPDNDATIELLSGGKVIATVKATGTYKFEKLAAGTYTLKVSKKNYVTREYTVTVADKAVTQNVKIHLIGDVDGNGKINVGDVSRIVAFVRKTKALGEYEQLVANVNGGKINVGDVAAVYAHVKGNKKLF